MRRCTKPFIFSAILILSLICSCSKTNKRRVLVEDVYAEGDISKDTVFNGLIRFYDTSHNRLVMVASYKNGVLDGPRTDYYKSGRPETKIKYENGKIKEQGQYLNGIRDQVWTIFYESGKEFILA